MLYQERLYEVTRQEQNGSLYWDNTVDQYRPTWWGAIQFTLHNAFPIRHIRAYRAVLAARRAIAGMPESGYPISAAKSVHFS